MEDAAKYVERAESCASHGSDEQTEDPATYWQREAQIQATLALVAAVVDLREVFALLVDGERSITVRSE